MKAWNMAGELHIPKNITFGLHNPSWVVKAAFQQSSGLMKTLLYPYCMSNLIKINDSHNLLTRLEMRGRGYVFLIVWLLRYW